MRWAREIQWHPWSIFHYVTHSNLTKVLSDRTFKYLQSYIRLALFFPYNYEETRALCHFARCAYNTTNTDLSNHINASHYCSVSYDKVRTARRILLSTRFCVKAFYPLSSGLMGAKISDNILHALLWSETLSIGFIYRHTPDTISQGFAEQQEHYRIANSPHQPNLFTHVQVDWTCEKPGVSERRLAVV